MATYLKNTYVDGSLTVEGEFKVQNLNLSEARVVTITDTEDLKEESRIIKFTDNNTQVLQNSVLDSYEYSLKDRTDHPSYPFPQENNGDKAAQIIVKSETKGKLPVHYDVLLHTKNTDTSNPPKLGSLAYTVGNWRLGDSNYDPEQTANIDDNAVLMIPVRPIHLWNTGISADYKWHYNEQEE